MGPEVFSVSASCQGSGTQALGEAEGTFAAWQRLHARRQVCSPSSTVAFGAGTGDRARRPAGEASAQAAPGEPRTSVRYHRPGHIDRLLGNVR
jgi:hypothetical protein